MNWSMSSLRYLGLRVRRFLVSLLNTGAPGVGGSVGLIPGANFGINACHALPTLARVRLPDSAPISTPGICGICPSLTSFLAPPHASRGAAAADQPEQAFLLL